MKRFAAVLLVSLLLASTAGAEDVFVPVDVDLTRMSSTMVYGQVYDMLVDPDAYLGKRVRMSGAFTTFVDTATEQTYYAVLIADATACCAQGFEFVWPEGHEPSDTDPQEGDSVIVTGLLETYLEGDIRYCHLRAETVELDQEGDL